MEINICPRWLLERSGISLDAQPHLALLLSALVTVIASPLLVRVPHFCLMHALLGVPCPGCGILHGMAALARMDVAGAWTANPGSFFVAALMLMQLLIHPAALCCVTIRGAVVRVSDCAAKATLAALLLVWFHRLVLGGMHAYRLLS